MPRLGLQEGISSIPQGDRVRLTTRTTTTQDAYKAPPATPLDKAKHSSVGLRRSNFAVMSDGKSRYETTTKAEYPAHSPSDVQRHSKNLQKTHAAFGDEGAGMAEARSSAQDAYPAYPSAEPAKAVHSQQWLRGTHYSLGDYPRPADQSVSAASYQPPPRDFKPARLLRKDLQKDNFPCGDPEKVKEYSSTLKQSYLVPQPEEQEVDLEERQRRRNALRAANFDLGRDAVFSSYATTTKDAFVPPADGQASQPASYDITELQRTSIQLGDRENQPMLGTTHQREFPEHEMQRQDKLGDSTKLRFTHFRLGDASVTSKQFTSVSRDAFAPPAKISTVDEHGVSTAALQRSHVPDGDRAKCTSYATTSSEAYKQLDASAARLARSSTQNNQWFRQSHFQLGASGGFNAQSSTRLDYGPHATGPVTKRQVDLQQSNIAQGDASKVTVNDYTSVQQRSFVPQHGKPAKPVNALPWLRATHYSMGDTKLDDYTSSYHRSFNKTQ